MPVLLEESKAHLRTLQSKAAVPGEDGEGYLTGSIKSSLRFLGIAEFVVNGDSSAFRRYVSEAARLQVRLFERAEAGDAISPASVYSIFVYKDILDALSSCDICTAELLAQKLGRPSKYIERCHPFDKAFAYTLKAFVSKLDDQMPKTLDQLSSACERRGIVDFAGYALTFRGLLHGDAKLAQEGLSLIATGHKKLTRRGRPFHGLGDEVL
ncbi:MAG TPA: hypothetical protein VLM40_13645, partial [Gemmata sp.]|nr:hypothetical protein [Gemmata sp.]